MNNLSSVRRIFAPSVFAISLVALAGCGEEGAADKVTKAIDSSAKQGTNAAQVGSEKAKATLQDTKTKAGDTLSKSKKFGRITFKITTAPVVVAPPIRSKR